MKQLAASIRNTSEKILSRDDVSAAPTTARLAQCLARAIERGFLSLEQVYAIFGAPGDWGYSTPIGKGLHNLYSEGEMTEEVERFPRVPERDEQGTACLYPGSAIYEGMAAIFDGAPAEMIILAPSQAALESRLSQLGISDEIDRSKCKAVRLEPVRSTPEKPAKKCCPDCQGAGWKPSQSSDGDPTDPCHLCKGTGKA